MEVRPRRVKRLDEKTHLPTDIVCIPDPADKLAVDVEGEIRPLSIHSQHVLTLQALNRILSPLAQQDLYTAWRAFQHGPRLGVRGNCEAVILLTRPANDQAIAEIAAWCRVLLAHVHISLSNKVAEALLWHSNHRPIIGRMDFDVVGLWLMIADVVVIEHQLIRPPAGRIR